jgi:DNA-binding transcriptional MerR regulator
MTATTKTTPKTSQETWLDWLPNAELQLTREELLEELNRRGTEVTEPQLVYWERQHVIPRPIRKHRDGVPRALYPTAAIEIIEQLRGMQDAGHSLRTIGSAMRRHAQIVALAAAGAVEEQAFEVEKALREYARRWEVAYGESKALGGKVVDIEYTLIAGNGRNLTGVRIPFRSPTDRDR